MVQQEEAQRKIFYRSYYDSDPRVTTAEEEDTSLRDVSLFDLISSFKYAIERMPKKFVHEIVRLNVTIDEQIEYILDYFSRRSEATFSELVKEMTEKIRVVVTFIALLEVIRSKQVLVRQSEPFGDVSIMRNVA
jgi:segregation and condensation protein A